MIIPAIRQARVAARAGCLAVSLVGIFIEAPAAFAQAEPAKPAKTELTPTKLAPAEGGGGSAVAHGPEWRIVPSISVQESFDDNVRQAVPGKEESDFTTTVSPGIDISRQGLSNIFHLNYAFSVIRHKDSDDLDRYQHQLSEASTTIFLPESLFLDTRASVSQQVINSAGSISAVNANAPKNNLTTVSNFSLSPYWRSRYQGWVNSELRYSFSGSIAGSGQVSDTTTNRITETLSNGPEFSRLLWTATLDDSETDRGGSTQVIAGTTNQSTTVSRRLAQFSPEYLVNSYVSLLGGVGYEVIEDPSLRNDIREPIGSVGVKLRPGPRTVLIGQLNHRFERNYFTGSASYLLGPTIRIDASYTEGIETSQSLANNQLSFLGTDEFGNFVDSRTAQAFQIGDNSFSLSDSAFRQKRSEVRGNAVLGRNTYNLLAFSEERTTDQTLITQSSYGVTANYHRLVNLLTDFNLTGRYRLTDFGTSDGRRDEQLGASAFLTYRLTNTLQGTLSYDLLIRTSNVANQDSTENVVTVGLRKTF